MIKGLHDEEMPREKLIKFGPDNLTDIELLAIIIRVGNKRKNVIEMSREILGKFNFREITQKSFHELLGFYGINKAKACQIIAIFELAKRLNIRIKPNKIKLKNSKDAYDVVKHDYMELKEEVVSALYCDTRNQIIKKEVVSKGGINYSVIDSRIIIKKAIILGAYGFFLFHNHPSGDPSPSIEDLNLTKKICEASKLFDIKFLDHIIVGDNTYYSMFDSGDL